MLILDTDVLSILEHAGPKAERLSVRFENSTESVATTIVSCEEQVRGWIATLASKRTNTDQIRAYARLRRLLESFCQWQILDFDEAAAVKFQELKNVKIRVGTMDLKIAAIALAHDATLITGNIKDFKQIPDLKFIDWTSE